MKDGIRIGLDLFYLFHGVLFGNYNGLRPVIKVKLVAEYIAI